MERKNKQTPREIAQAVSALVTFDLLGVRGLDTDPVVDEVRQTSVESAWPILKNLDTNDMMAVINTMSERLAEHGEDIPTLTARLLSKIEDWREE